MPSPSRHVLKFGGTSVRDSRAWEAVETILRRRMAGPGAPAIVMVHSALPGVTDLLDALAGALASGRDGEADDLRRRVVQVHREAARDILGAEAPEVDLLLEELEGWEHVAQPADRARLLALGERLSTRLGCRRLLDRGLPVRLEDATRFLQVSEPEGPRGWLDAECSATRSAHVGRLLDDLTADGSIVLTQGFLASTPSGATALLGRGGSDTAAACLAGRWGADLLEIWTDVPGMFTADPRKVPSARLLRRLGHAEAQEIATTGSRVLHPRCIPALRDAGIPIRIGSTLRPDDTGTLVEPGGPDGPPQLKAVSWKRDVVLVSMETVGMWQEVGFLARAFRVFQEVGLSVDLVSTSETSVTVSLDASANLLDPARLEALEAGLSEVCRVTILRDCAAVSLVGQGIRAMLHRMSPALESFEEHRIHLVSQAASDLNLTVVVDGDQGERLARSLHRLLLEDAVRPELFGPSWSELEGRARTDGATSRSWWRREARRIGEAVDRSSTAGAAYVYHLPTVRARLDELRALGSVDRVLYAMKANAHPEILRLVGGEADTGFECVSPGEIERVLASCPELDPRRILFTPNFASRDEMARGFQAGVRVTLDSLHPLEAWPELFIGGEVLVRLDPGRGAGHHEKVSTAGPGSKFGIHPDDVPELLERARGADLRITGLHVHAGSGVGGTEHWERMGRFLLEMATEFPDLEVLDVGGGLPVPRHAVDPPLDLAALDAGLARIRSVRPELDLWIEPGRYLVAEAGVLAARVTQVKRKGGTTWVGLATGMNSFIRPALYGAWHEIANLTRADEPPEERVQVVGPICETGDRLGADRLFPRTREGDLVVVARAGAYGRVMASSYNLRPPAAEHVLTD
ncbi:MAG: bifunctional aspartate kinase/diaminopimelate decarboxylase [Gemmatimonadales bacterium]|nr:MAG: bifunctional aspartate kinase/diaminopimelate decarboxylase [Gemmatimonadales bacterium]